MGFETHLIGTLVLFVINQKGPGRIFIRFLPLGASPVTSASLVMDLNLTSGQFSMDFP